MLPKEPVMLLSYVNLKLRDYYSDVSQMYEDLGVDGREIEEKLASIGYHYDKERNQFV